MSRRICIKTFLLNGISQKYFDHYVWACRWLKLHDLYIDPREEHYKYGSAWL